MKIYYREKYPNYYFWTTKENGLFCLRLDVPDMDTYILCSCSVSHEDELMAFSNSKEVSEKYTKLFNDNYDKKNNRKALYTVIKSLFETSDEELDAIYGRDMVIHNIVNKSIDRFVTKKHLKNRDLEWYFSNLYDDAKFLSKSYKWNDERVINYLNKRVIPKLLYPDFAMVDVFSNCHPTKRDLLHEFYTCNKQEEEIMDKAVELFPNDEDIDKAYYYFIEERNKLKENE